MKDLVFKTTQQIAKDFSIQSLEKKELSEEELLNILSNQVAYYLEYELEFLFSSLYRLDIDEKKVREALLPSNEIPANVAIAQLIIDRQKQRVFTKQFYKQEKLKDLEDGLEY